MQAAGELLLECRGRDVSELDHPTPCATFGVVISFRTKAWRTCRRRSSSSIAANDGQPPSVIVEPEADTLGDLLRSEEGALRLVPVTEEGGYDL